MMYISNVAEPKTGFAEASAKAQEAAGDKPEGEE